MTSDSGETISHHKSKRSSRGLKLTLLVFGLTMLVLGVGLMAMYLRWGNRRLGLCGIIYILTSIVVLGVREIIGEMRKARRRRYRQNDDPNGLQP